MEIRIVAFNATTDNQTKPLNVVTTLLSPDDFPAHAIGKLYGCRWCSEIDLFSIKQSLNLDHLRCKSPDIILQELLLVLRAYTAKSQR